MKLFDLFRRKTPDISEALFPNGEKDIERDVDRINQIFQGRLPIAECRDLLFKAKALLYMSEDKSWERIGASMRVYSEGKLREVELRGAYVYLAGEATYYDTISTHFRRTGDRARIPGEVATAAAIYAEGVDLDELPNGSGDFGYELTNPIPTISVYDSKEYLTSLRFEGKEVVYVRVGSEPGKISLAPVDIYEVSCGGRIVANLFVSPYQKRNSTKAPRGFSIGLSGSFDGAPVLPAAGKAMPVEELIALLEVDCENVSKLVDEIDGRLANEHEAGIFVASLAIVGVLASDKPSAERFSDQLVGAWLTRPRQRSTSSHPTPAREVLVERLQEKYPVYRDLFLKCIKSSESEEAHNSAVQLLWELFTNCTGKQKPKREGGFLALVSASADLVAIGSAIVSRSNEVAQR